MIFFFYLLSKNLMLICILIDNYIVNKNVIIQMTLLKIFWCLHDSTASHAFALKLIWIFWYASYYGIYDKYIKFRILKQRVKDLKWIVYQYFVLIIIYQRFYKYWYMYVHCKSSCSNNNDNIDIILKKKKNVVKR